MEKTLIIFKPSAIERGLVGEILSRFERKRLFLKGLKMIQLSDAILNEHYVHLKDKPFFESLKEAMQNTPVIVCCFEGKDVVQVVRNMCGTTNARDAQPGTIRGDYGMSVVRNIIHASDTIKNAEIEVNRFFNPEELFTYRPSNIGFYYGIDEI